MKTGNIYVEPKWVLYNAFKVLMISKYKRTIEYNNMCSSVQDHGIKFNCFIKSWFRKPLKL